MSGTALAPSTPFDVATCSRALRGLGETGVAGVLRQSVATKPLISLRKLASATLQHLQHLISRAYMRVWASAGACARVLVGVASVASVAKSKCIYISMLYLQHPAILRLLQGVAAIAGVQGLGLSVWRETIKYCRIFNGLGFSGSALAGTGRFGGVGARARGWLAGSALDLAGSEVQTGAGGWPGGRADRVEQYQGVSGHGLGWSQSQVGATQRKASCFQHVSPDHALAGRTCARPLRSATTPPASGRTLPPATGRAPSPQPAFQGVSRSGTLHLSALAKKFPEKFRAAGAAGHRGRIDGRGTGSGRGWRSGPTPGSGLQGSAHV